MVNSQRKKQIVFVELAPSIPIFKIARSLRLTGKYETVLISFSKVDQDFIKKGFDKTIIFEMKNIDSIAGITSFIKQIFKPEARKFLEKTKRLKPYLVQFTGPNVLTMFSMYLFRKTPRVYYAYDIWKFYDKKFSLKKNSGIMQFFHKFIERAHFKIADGILHKGPPGELDLLNYKVDALDLSFIPYCLDEWIYAPKKRERHKEWHLVFAGGPWISWEGHISFLKIMEIITSQKIYFHLYCPYDIDMGVYKKIEKTNEYFNLHKGENPENLNKKIFKYDYGILFDFYDTSIVNVSWSKTTMANKIFNYVEAGLPVITNKQLEFMCEIIEENNMGIMIKDFKDLKNLRKILEKQNYEQLQKNVHKAQEKFKLSKNIEKLERFYEEVVEVKKVKKVNYC